MHPEGVQRGLGRSWSSLRTRLTPLQRGLSWPWQPPWRRMRRTKRRMWTLEGAVMRTSSQCVRAGSAQLGGQAAAEKKGTGRPKGWIGRGTREAETQHNTRTHTHTHTHTHDTIPNTGWDETGQGQAKRGKNTPGKSAGREKTRGGAQHHSNHTTQRKTRDSKTTQVLILRTRQDQTRGARGDNTTPVTTRTK